MNKRKPQGLKGPSLDKNNKKKVVKNEHYYKLKKRSLIKRGIIVATVFSGFATFWYIKEVPVKAHMTIENSTIEWTPKKENLKGLRFQVVKDGEIVHETTNLKFIDKNQKDTGIPDDISEINTYRNVKTLKILWKEPKDNGSSNNYQIFALNKFGRKVFKSEEVSGGSVSGIDKYIIKFKGEEFESEKPEFVINCEDLKKGKYTIDIKSVDKEGNESEFKTFAFNIDNVKFEFKGRKIIPEEPKYTNDDYYFYIIEKDIADNIQDIPQYDKKMFLVDEDISNVLNLDLKPTMTTPSFVVKNQKLALSWKNPSESKESYDFYVEIVNKDTLEKKYSDLLKGTILNENLGFHYAINNSSSYKVTADDEYTNANYLEMDINKFDKNKKYYFHIATIDSLGTLSNTKTISVNLRDTSTIDTIENKSEYTKKIVYKTKDVTEENYKKVATVISNNFALQKIKQLNNEGIKVYLIKNNFKEYLKQNYKIDARVDDCVKDGKSIYFNVNKSTDCLVNTISSSLK